METIGVNQNGFKGFLLNVSKFWWGPQQNEFDLERSGYGIYSNDTVYI